MEIPFVGYKIQYQNLKKEIDLAIENVLSRGDLILRKDVEDFEKNLADFVGTKYALGLNSGTDALFFSLLALGIGERANGSKEDEVITVSHTFVASISAIVQAGAKPILVDVKENDYLMDVEKLEKAITPKTKAIIPVYLNGRMCQMDKIMEIAQKHNLYIIEDSAQALGASYKFQISSKSQPTGISRENEIKRAGSIGITGCFSFYPAKILGSFGDGGGLTTNSKEIYEKVKLLRDHGQKTKTEIVLYGWNSRLDNLQAAILNIKIKYLPKWIERRREIAGLYEKGLEKISEINLPPGPDSDKNYYDVFQNYVLRAKKRDELFNFLKKNGIETLIKDPIPNHWHKGLNLSHFKLPVSEKIAKEVISLPMYPELTDEQIKYIISAIRSFYQKS